MVKMIKQECSLLQLDMTDEQINELIKISKEDLEKVKFDALSEEQTVSYDVEKSDKGPRAINVRVV